MGGKFPEGQTIVNHLCSEIWEGASFKQHGWCRLVSSITDSFNDVICFSLLTIVLKEKAFSVLLGYLLLAQYLLISCFNKSRINFKLTDLLKQEEYVGLNSLFCVVVSYISIYHNVAFPSIKVI